MHSIPPTGALCIVFMLSAPLSVLMSVPCYTPAAWPQNSRAVMLGVGQHAVPAGESIPVPKME